VRETIPSATLTEAVDAFLLAKRVANCSSRTIGNYTDVLARFRRESQLTQIHEATVVTVQRYLTGLQQGGLRPASLFTHFTVLRVFFRWAVDAGVLPQHPMRGIKMRSPKTLPRVPEDEAVRKLLLACDASFEGRRNAALVALMADSGLRVSEALRLRVEDVNFSARTLAVREGKGGKDGVGFFGAETAQIIRASLAARSEAVPEDFLFTDRHARPLSRSHGTHILHRLSIRAGLSRKIGPHALRHYAATSILKQTGDLELVRQVLRHESLAMSLRYAQITKPEISRKFRRASPLDNLRAGR